MVIYHYTNCRLTHGLINKAISCSLTRLERERETSIADPSTPGHHVVSSSFVAIEKPSPNPKLESLQK